MNQKADERSIGVCPRSSLLVRSTTPAPEQSEPKISLASTLPGNVLEQKFASAHGTVTLLLPSLPLSFLLFTHADGYCTIRVRKSLRVSPGWWCKPYPPPSLLPFSCTSTVWVCVSCVSEENQHKPKRGTHPLRNGWQKKWSGVSRVCPQRTQVKSQKHHRGFRLSAKTVLTRLRLLILSVCEWSLRKPP